MNHFLITLLLSLALLAAIGWATYWTHQKHGSEGEQVFRTLLTLLVAGTVIVLVFAVNYILASTGLHRLIGAEKIVKGDPIARMFFGGSGLRSNHLFALMIVVASFMTAGYLLRTLGQTVKACKNEAWQQNRNKFGLLLVKLVAAAVIAGYCLWLDTTLLLARNAQMMYADTYAVSGASLPAPGIIIHEHRRELGGYLLGILLVWYPLYILMAEKHFASSKARFSAACRDLALSRAQAAQVNPGPVLPVDPIAPNGAPPVPAMPIVVPVAAPAGGPNRTPEAPMPGGAAPFVRPIPFNPGPQERNGH